MGEAVYLKRAMSGRYEPADQASHDTLARFKIGDVFKAEVSRPRNLAWHRKLFALLNLILENQTRYKSTDELLDAIKVYLGHCETIILRNGDVVKMPKSIAFHAMDQAAFEDFWKRLVRVICEEIVPGMDDEALERELLDMVA